ncbi:MULTISPECIES: molybdate ABC transporter substrate-binding protein [unclassified Paenibacillus]|uniref:molybdate ABC transporter substrate-binding protein n=1 Tax=unclassified Paenibacillus TaxID=185978 RepID=UPI0024069D25|nr:MULTISPECIES: molybdate ABC transporter substrate-binding protein [unclassified Paenibacillus]MDF9842387.1 molybdate transport system substrate-binding protein [Paenibacillus sp. PastF-2]MDF9848977.1 molybdate transport system substrate-binding protein [Paenibacillus sp. PastM-2]MDF9855547.1 molybdate transport system substrate-binding protein [Paenibacillus sp. PastF-1]MDH6480819.1 molybdate transport system substrate-binding protein [Paenibacillus sp. PastH-2]MDH6508241.1 molybdate transp
MLKRLAVIIMSVFLVSGASVATPGLEVQAAAKKTEIIVSAAASLQDSLDKIAVQYEKQHPDIDLVFNYGASGTLQKQIEQGAPADLFFSAGDKQMKALVDGGLISENKQLLKNQLVLVVPVSSQTKITSITQLTDKAFKKVAVGQPESVPAGQYAQQSLTAKKVWDTLQSKLVFAKDVRQVLSYVETGNADAGFVYKTDALTSAKVKIALTVGAHVHKAINYPVGIVKESDHQAEARAFYNYVQTKAAGSIFTSYGFSLAD